MLSRLPVIFPSHKQWAIVSRPPLEWLRRKALQGVGPWLKEHRILRGWHTPTHTQTRRHRHSRGLARYLIPAIEANICERGMLAVLNLQVPSGTSKHIHVCERNEKKKVSKCFLWSVVIRESRNSNAFRRASVSKARTVMLPSAFSFPATLQLQKHDSVLQAAVKVERRRRTVSAVLDV